MLSEGVRHLPKGGSGVADVVFLSLLITATLTAFYFMTTVKGTVQMVKEIRFTILWLYSQGNI